MSGSFRCGACGHECGEVYATLERPTGDPSTIFEETVLCAECRREVVEVLGLGAAPMPGGGLDAEREVRGFGQ
jgi:hypothetical protein